MCTSTQVSTSLRHQKKASDPLELDLEAAVSLPVWVLGTKLRKST